MSMGVGQKANGFHRHFTVFIEDGFIHVHCHDFPYEHIVSRIAVNFHNLALQIYR